MKQKLLNVGVFTYDFYPIFGGMGRHIYELYLQNEKEKQVNLFVFSPNENKLPRHIPFHTETKQSKFKNIALSVYFNREIVQLIKMHKLDIVHIHGGPGGIFLTKKLSVPVIYTVHHTYWQQYNYISSQRWKYIFYLFEKKSYVYADKIICVSDDTKNIVLSRYGVDQSKLVVIPNGIDLSKYKPIAKNNNESKHLLYLGRLDKRKGIDFLVKTMKLVNEKDPGIVLDVVGEGQLRSSLERFAKDNNLNIVFHGGISDEELNKLYESIAVQIVPSLFEGFGLSVLEGMAKGIPIIATDVDGIRGLIQNNESGLLVKFNDKRELASRIIDILKNKQKREKFAKNGYSKSHKYSSSNSYQQVINTYLGER